MKAIGTSSLPDVLDKAFYWRLADEASHAAIVLSAAKRRQVISDDIGEPLSDVAELMRAILGQIPVAKNPTMVFPDVVVFVGRHLLPGLGHNGDFGTAQYPEFAKMTKQWVEWFEAAANCTPTAIPVEDLEAMAGLYGVVSDVASAYYYRLVGPGGRRFSLAA